MTMSYHTATTSTTTTTAAAADDEAGKDSSADVTDSAAAGAGSKGMMEFFRKRYKSAGATAVSGGADDSQLIVTDVSLTTGTDAECKSSTSDRDRPTLEVHKEYGYYHTVSSSDARVLRAALAKERVPIFRRSESKARRSTAGMRFAYPKDRITEGEMSQTDGQSFSSARSDSKSFRDIFLRRRNRSDRSEQNAELSAEVKAKSGRVRVRNFLVSFRSRPRAVSVSYAPVDVTSTSTVSMATSSAATTVQTVGKKKKFKVTPATLLPALKRPEPPRVGPQDFVEMYCRSRTTSDPRSDAILKARVAANLHKVSGVACSWSQSTG